MTSTILLVDDVRLFLEMQKEFLEYASVQVLTARNGHEALQAIGQKRPDLVFMDLEMPEMDGVECCRTIKTDTRLSGIPVVMITAKGDSASQQLCRAAGCDGFLTKPLSRALFLETAGHFVPNLDRRAKRSPVALPAVLKSRNCTANGTLQDLSAGGAFIVAQFDAEVGRSVEISFTLPNGTTQDCRAKVVWTRQAGPSRPAGFGISFVLLPATTRSDLERFLKQESAQAT